MYKIIGANQVEYGPITADQLRQWIAEGRVNAQTLAQAEGETGWKPMSSFPEFAASFPAAPGPQTPGSSPMPGAYPVNPDMGRAHALEQVSVPAIGLMVCGGLGVIAGFLRIFSGLFGIGMASQQGAFQQLNQQNPELAKMIMGLSGTMGVVIGVFVIAYSVFTIFAGMKMKNLQGYGMAMTASILSMLPCTCPCCIVGLVFGIWSLIVLSKTEVKSYFS